MDSDISPFMCTFHIVKHTEYTFCMSKTTQNKLRDSMIDDSMLSTLNCQLNGYSKNLLHN